MQKPGQTATGSVFPHYGGTSQALQGVEGDVRGLKASGLTHDPDRVQFPDSGDAMLPAIRRGVPRCGGRPRHRRQLRLIQPAFSLTGPWRCLRRRPCGSGDLALRSATHCVTGPLCFYPDPPPLQGCYRAFSPLPGVSPSWTSQAFQLRLSSSTSVEFLANSNRQATQGWSRS